METDSIINIFREITPQSDLSPETLLEEIEGWSSMAVIGLMAAIDKQFGVAIDPVSLGMCETISDVTSAVESRLDTGE